MSVSETIMSVDIAQLNQPVSDMMKMLQQTGHRHFSEDNAWENCLCVLVMNMEPRCKTYRFLEALPYGDAALDEMATLNTLAHLGYFARPIKTRLSELDPRLLPALFIPDNAPPVAVLSHGVDEMTIVANRRITDSAKEELTQANGTVWLFEKFDESKSVLSKFMRDGSGYSWFRALMGRFGSAFQQILLSGLLLNIITLFTPIFTMLVYDRVIASGGIGTLPMLALGAMMAIGFEWMLRRVRSQGLSWLGARMDNIVSNRIFSHLIGLSPALIERASVSAQIARIKTFESIRDFFSGSVFLSLIEFPFVIISLIAIYAVAGPLVWVPVAMVSCYALLFYVMQKKVKVSIRLAAKATSAKQQFSIETFEKISGVRSYGLTARWQQKFRDLSGREMLSHFRLNWLGMVAETLANSLTILSAVATVSFGVMLIWNHQMSTGALVASMILVWRVLTPFYSICTMIPRLEQIRNSIIQVNKLMDLDTEVMEAKASARLQYMRGSITFTDAGLSYEDDTDPVLTNLNFNAKPGELTIIMGENGSGKSSLLKMIKGLYRANLGSVQIDGFDIRQLDTMDLRRQIAYVPQNPDIFYGSVIENLRISNPLATDMDIEVALQLADAWDDVQKMPQGLNTMISRHGANAIPVNLASRLSLARAYLHPAQVLLIDEIANALLSGQTGINLKNYLLRNKGKRTVFMVTYREDFMNLSDNVLLLQRGETPQVVQPKSKSNSKPFQQREVA